MFLVFIVIEEYLHHFSCNVELPKRFVSAYEGSSVWCEICFYVDSVYAGKTVQLQTYEDVVGEEFDVGGVYY